MQSRSLKLIVHFVITADDTQAFHYLCCAGFKEQLGLWPAAALWFGVYGIFIQTLLTFLVRFKDRRHCQANKNIDHSILGHYTTYFDLCEPETIFFKQKRLLR